MENTEGNREIRRLEQELLDSRHLRFSLLNRDQALGLAHVLKAHNDAVNKSAVISGDQSQRYADGCRNAD